MLEYIGLISCLIGFLYVIYYFCEFLASNKNIYPIIVSILFVLMGCGAYWQSQKITELYKRVPPEMEMTHDIDYSFMHTSEINDSLLYLVFDYYGVTDAKYVLAQAKIESGHFTSDVFKKTNNFLGLYDSKNKCYFSFDSWQDCVKGYVNSVQYRKKPNETHTDFLKRIGYAEDPAYINKVKQIYNTL